MHYSQYIYLTYFIYKKREEEAFEYQNQKLFGIKYYKYFFTVSIYAIIMALLSLFGKFDDSSRVTDLYKKAPEHMEDYAQKLSLGMEQLNNLVTTEDEEQEFSSTILEETITSWQSKFDLKDGGFRGAPKFMMPNNLSFLLRYGFQHQQKEILDFVEFSLEKMAQGGIYDALGGGFSRYSVDERWHIPHFEKMLYDNAQLIELYSDAYAVFKNEKFKKVVEESLQFIQRELTAQQGYFFAALDADSLTEENLKKEGAFYTWKKE
jgi:uncharacterized protein YyaL (SSP411 family)